MIAAPEVTSPESATQFTLWCISQIGLGYHPDTLFADYVDEKGNAVFSAEDAEHLDRLQEAAFEHLDPYEVGLAEFHRMVGEYVEQPATSV